MIKFSHIADCHIGSWRDPKITELNFQSFSSAVDLSLKEKVDFVLIAGDLFNTSMPSIDYINKTVKELVKLKENNISVYAIAGSHDFSPSGKTMLKVLESAGLLKNALQGEVIEGKLKLNPIIIEDKKILISGMLGKKGTLEKYYYDAIDYDYIDEMLNSKKDFFKIFMLHSALTELKPKELIDMPSQPISVLPKGFDYYCAGHVHYKFNENIDGLGRVVYPGPTFPNNFKEISELKHGSFCIVNIDDDKKFEIKFVELNLKEIEYFKFNLEGKSSFDAKIFIESEIEKKEIFNKIVLIKLFGKMNCSINEFNIREIIDFCESKKPFYVMKNSFMLEGKEDNIIVKNHGNLEDIERKIIGDNFENINEVSELISILDTEKKEGETIMTYEDRLIKDTIHHILR